MAVSGVERAHATTTAWGRTAFLAGVVSAVGLLLQTALYGLLTGIVLAPVLMALTGRSLDRDAARVSGEERSGAPSGPGRAPSGA